MLILAADAGGSTVRHVQTYSGYGRMRLLKTIYSKSELAAAIGRGSPVSMALLTDEGLAEAFASAHATEQEERI